MACEESLLPSTDAQRAFWDDWNTSHRAEGLDDFMRRQSEVLLRWAATIGERPRLLEVGCGTGWLTKIAVTRLGAEATGIDLSPAAIELARVACPEAEFVCGNFSATGLQGPFDVVVSADVIGHVPDHGEFIENVASLLRPGGILVLMTQNPFVWNRSSYLTPRGEGQLRNWPSLRELRRMLSTNFRILEVTSIVPGGDRGVLRLVNHRFLAGALRRLIGRRRATRLYERVLLGRELVVIAQRA